MQCYNNVMVLGNVWIMGQQYGAVLKVLDAEILGYDDSSGGTAVTNPFK